MPAPIPLIVVMREIDPSPRAVRKQYEDQVEAMILARRKISIPFRHPDLGHGQRGGNLFDLVGGFGFASS